MNVKSVSPGARRDHRVLYLDLATLGHGAKQKIGKTIPSLGPIEPEVADHAIRLVVIDGVVTKLSPDFQVVPSNQLGDHVAELQSARGFIQRLSG